MEDADGLSRPFPARRVVACVVGLLLGGALAIVLAAPTYDLLHGWGASTTFPKVLRRLLLVPVALVLFVGIRPWRDGSLASYGLVGPNARARPAVLAALATLAAGLALLALHFAMGWMTWEPSPRAGEFARRAAVYVVGGLAGGLVEEWFFRGWMFGVLRRRASAVVAALVVAVASGVVHAFRPTALDAPVSHDVAGALEAIGGWISGVATGEEFGASFVGLFLLSLVLQAAYLRTRTLWTAVAIHGTGLWLLHVHGALTESHVERTWAGSKWLYDGAPAWILLATLAIVLWPRERGVRSSG